MNLNELKEFLFKFDLNEKKIDDFLKEKKLFFDSNKNIYLSKTNNFEIQNLIFINLNKVVVSRYFLKFIKESIQNIIEILNEKQALNFTYSKDLFLESVKNSKDKKFSKNKYYVVLFEDKILGYSEFVKIGNKFVFKNKMNVGEYLKE